MLCGDVTAKEDTIEEALQAIDDHLRVQHPDIYGPGPERWPDGGIVVDDDTLLPSDFKEN